MHYSFKLVSILIFLNLINSAVLAANCTTIADNTWDCGIPDPSDNLIVNHKVTITAIFNATGAITINSGGQLTLTQNISIEGCIINVQPGGTLIIEGKAVFGSNSSITNQGTLSFSNDFTLGNSASLISGGYVTVSGKVLIEQGSTLIIETGSTFLAYNDLELNSNDITINGLVEVEGSFTNNKSISGDGQINYINSCDGLGTINGVSSGDFCNSGSFDLTGLLCGPDTINPTISDMPVNMTLYTSFDACKIVANWTTPTANDNCSLQSFTSSNNSGDLFQVGTTRVTYTAVDASNNTISAGFDITVKDTISPVFNNIPENSTQYVDAGSCGAIVNWTLPTATDNCSLQSLTSSENSGDFFSIGTTTVTYTAFDASNNTISVGFDITVKDTISPVIIDIPKNSTQYVDAGSCGAIVNWTLPSATDNCSLTSLTSSGNSGDFFSIGTTTVTYTAVDASNNTVSAGFDITVKDTISPVFNNIPENSTQYVDAGSCGANVIWTLPTATDNCSLPSLTSSDNSGDFFSIGTTTVTYTAVDASNNSVSAGFDITVKDTISPVFNNIPENSTQYVEGGSCSTIVNWTLPTATDNCSLQSLTSSDNSGDFFSIGKTTVTYTAVDASNNSVSASFDITVKDTISPVFNNIPENSTQYVDAGSCGAIVNWTLPGAKDNCSLQSFTSSNNSGDLFQVGTTTVTYTAVDVSDNLVSASFDITVKDTIFPVITNIPRNIIQNADAGTCGAIVNWTLPDVRDKLFGFLEFQQNPGDFFKVGISTVSYTALDINGNSTSLTFEVKVKNNNEQVVHLAFNDTTIVIGESIQLFAEGGVRYRWEPVDFLDNPEVPDPIAFPTEDITYTVFMRTESGCIARDYVTINVSEEHSYYIPEMFTPDGDGVNDILFVNTLGYKNIDFKLFNRFGQLVFMTDNPDVGWDGKFNGNIQNPDTYVYTIALETSTNQFVNGKGSLQLVR